jgi:DNA-binding transcriptional ArsR family regulator
MLSSVESNENYQEARLDRVFRALGDPTRRKLLARLTEGPAMVTELAKPFDMSLPAVGKHVRVLESAGLIERTIDGRVHRCALNALPLKSAGDWLECYQQFWSESLDSLSDYMQGSSGENMNTSANKNRP